MDYNSSKVLKDKMNNFTSSMNTPSTSSTAHAHSESKKTILSKQLNLEDMIVEDEPPFQQSFEQSPSLIGFGIFTLSSNYEKNSKIHGIQNGCEHSSSTQYGEQCSTPSESSLVSGERFVSHRYGDGLILDEYGSPNIIPTRYNGGDITSDTSPTVLSCSCNNGSGLPTLTRTSGHVILAPSLDPSKRHGSCMYDSTVRSESIHDRDNTECDSVKRPNSFSYTTPRIDNMHYEDGVDDDRPISYSQIRYLRSVQQSSSTHQENGTIENRINNEQESQRKGSLSCIDGPRYSLPFVVLENNKELAHNDDTNDKKISYIGYNAGPEKSKTFTGLSSRESEPVRENTSLSSGFRAMFTPRASPGNPNQGLSVVEDDFVKEEKKEIEHSSPRKGRDTVPSWKFFPSDNGTKNPIDVIDHESEVVLLRRPVEKRFSGLFF